MDGVFLVQSQGSGIGPDKAAGKYLIRQLGKIAFFEGLHKIRADPGFGRHLIKRQTLRLTNLSKKLASTDSMVVAYGLMRARSSFAAVAYSPPLSRVETFTKASRARTSRPSW